MEYTVITTSGTVRLTATNDDEATRLATSQTGGAVIAISTRRTVADRNEPAQCEATDGDPT